MKTANKRTLSSQIWLERQLNDPYVARAKREGYRSRAAFKLLEIDEKYQSLKPGQRVVDLGAAPGGWSQIAAERVGREGAGWSASTSCPSIPCRASSSSQLDFLDESAPAQLIELLGGPADVVMSDMAANTTGHKKTDHLRIMGLAEAAIYFAREVLAPGGAFVAKVFQGGTEGAASGRPEARLRGGAPRQARREPRRFGGTLCDGDRFPGHRRQRAARLLGLCSTRSSSGGGPWLRTASASSASARSPRTSTCRLSARIPDFELLAVSSQRGLSPEDAKHTFVDYREMLKLPDLDAVAICTPPQVRHDIASEALQRRQERASGKAAGRDLERTRGSEAHRRDRSARSLFTTWHAQYNNGVDEARRPSPGRRQAAARHLEGGCAALASGPGMDLAGGRLRRLRSRHQRAVDRHAASCREPVFIKPSSLEFPANRDAPIAANLAFSIGPMARGSAGGLRLAPDRPADLGYRGRDGSRPAPASSRMAAARSRSTAGGGGGGSRRIPGHLPALRRAAESAASRMSTTCRSASWRTPS